MTHDLRCVCDACWPARLGDMRALIVADARRRGAELLARAARRPVARPRRAKVSARSPRKALRRHLAATKLPPELVDLVMPAEPPAPIDSGRPVRSRAPRVPSARVELPAPVDATTLADRGPSRLPPSGPFAELATVPNLDQVVAEAVAAVAPLVEERTRPYRTPAPSGAEMMKPIRERTFTAPGRTIEAPPPPVAYRPAKPRRVIDGAKLTVGRRAEPDESPLPCVPVDLAAIGGSSFDIGRAWGGGEVGDVRASQQQPAATSGVKEMKREEDLRRVVVAQPEPA